jgi:hypothetical protein
VIENRRSEQERTNNVIYPVELCSTNDHTFRKMNDKPSQYTKVSKVTYSVTLNSLQLLIHKPFLKGKAIPLQAWTGPEGSTRATFPDFKTIGT